MIQEEVTKVILAVVIGAVFFLAIYFGFKWVDND